MYLSQFWIDPRMKWNPKDFDGQTHAFLHNWEVWSPDMAALNRFDSVFDLSIFFATYYNDKSKRCVSLGFERICETYPISSAETHPSTLKFRTVCNQKCMEIAQKKDCISMWNNCTFWSKIRECGMKSRIEIFEIVVISASSHCTRTCSGCGSRRDDWATLPTCTSVRACTLPWTARWVDECIFLSSGNWPFILSNNLEKRQPFISEIRTVWTSVAARRSS